MRNLWYPRSIADYVPQHEHRKLLADNVPMSRDYQFIPTPMGKALPKQAEEPEKAQVQLLDPERIGVTLSEEFQLHPEQATSALVAHHPEAKYFNV